MTNTTDNTVPNTDQTPSRIIINNPPGMSNAQVALLVAAMRPLGDYDGTQDLFGFATRMVDWLDRQDQPTPA